MKEFLAVVFLCLPVWGQAVNSGAGQYSGGAVWGTGSGVLACGPPNYCAYGGQDIIAEADPLPELSSDSTGLYRNNAVVQDTSYASHGQTVFSPYIRCTDAAFAPATPNATFSAGIGGSGMGVLFNTTDNLIHLSASIGGDPITYFDPVNLKCGDPITGHLIIQGKNSANLNPSNTATQVFGGGEFSKTNANLWYAYGVTTDVSNATAVTPYTIRTDAGHEGEFSVGSTLTDFIYGIPYGANIAEWQPGRHYNFGDYVQHTLSSSEYLNWSAGMSVALGDIVVSPGGCAFKAIVAGQTSGTNPLPTSSTCNTNKVTDGAVSWQGLHGPAVFSYQLTGPSIGGTSSASAGSVAWVTAGSPPGHPDFMGTVTDGSLTWTNVGPVDPPIWITWGGTSRDGTKFSDAMSSNTYGSAALTYTNSKFAGGQGGGIYVVVFDSATNIYHMLNSATGIQTDWVCMIGGLQSTGGGYNCAGGSRTPVTAGLTLAGGTTDVPIGQATQSSCSFMLHNAKLSFNGKYMLIVDQGSPISCAGSTGFYVWRPLQTPFDVTTQFLETGWGMNHWALQANHAISLSAGGSASSYGVYMSKLELANPTLPLSGEYYFQIAAPGTSTPNCTPKSGGPPYPTPTCALGDAIDNHISGTYAPDDSDTWPTVGATYNYASLDPRPFQAYQDEIVGTTTSPTWSDPTAPNASQKQWRFGHIGATGTNDLFNIQFSIGQMSQSGRFYAVGTDYRGLFGSNTGLPPSSFPVTPTGSPRCLGGYPWLPNTQYHVGDMIHPISGTSGGGTHYPVFMATAISGNGTSQATAPAWPTLAAGIPWPTAAYTTVTDNPGPNQIVWTELADKTDCRGDVLVFQLR